MVNPLLRLAVSQNNRPKRFAVLEAGSPERDGFHAEEIKVGGILGASRHPQGGPARQEQMLTRQYDPVTSW